MRNLLLGLMITASFSSAALAAESVITLNFKNMMLTSQDSGAAMIDLTNEIKKQSPQTNISGQRIKSVVVTGQPSFIGATLILLVSGQAVDSQTVEDSSSQTISLSTNLPNTPAPWILGLRGQLSLQKVEVTLDNQLSDTAPSKPTTPSVGQQPPVQTTTPPSSTTKRPDDFFMGEKILAISSTTGVIDYVTYAGPDGDGFYSVNYGGLVYDGWSRDQLAKTSGCNGNLCVGQRVSSNEGDDLTVIGILPGDSLVVEDSYNHTKSVAEKSDLSSAHVAPPAPVVHSRFVTGQTVLYIDSSNRVATVTIARVRDDGSSDINYNGKVYRISTSSHLATTRGCTRDGFCVGAKVMALSGNGGTYRATIMGIQSDTLVVLTFAGQNGMVGNWPVSTIQR